LDEVKSMKAKPIYSLVQPFIAGLLALLPLALTLMVVLWLAQFVASLLGPGSLFGSVLGSIGLAFASNERVAYLMGLAVALAGIYSLGLLVGAGLKSQWQDLTDRLMKHLPGVRTVYDASKRLLGLFGRKDANEYKAMTPVWCFFGGEGGTAVLALMPTSEPLVIHGHAYHVILVPSAPVPFGGGLLYVPADWVKPAGFAVDGLLNIYVSMGVSSPGFLTVNPARSIGATTKDSG
jgi:uncharacterized membrane protein